MSVMDLFQWWNLVFDLPFVAALIPLLLQATGAAHLGHGAHGVHVGHVGLHGHHHIEAGAHAPAHVGHGHDAAVAHHGHAHAEHHAESPGMLSRALGLLGIGRVPIMMVFSSFSFVWGATGIICNQVFGKMFPVPGMFIWPSIGVSLISSLALTSVLSKGVSRLMPNVETYTTSREDFLGKVGHALYAITPTSGAAVVLDNESNRVQIKCRTEDMLAIPRGAKVALLRYDEQTETYFVRQANAAFDGSPTQKLLQ